jgi:hypothetical protein
LFTRDPPQRAQKAEEMTKVPKVYLVLGCFVLLLTLLFFDSGAQFLR